MSFLDSCPSLVLISQSYTIIIYTVTYELNSLLGTFLQEVIQSFTLSFDSKPEIIPWHAISQHDIDILRPQRVMVTLKGELSSWIWTNVPNTNAQVVPLAREKLLGPDIHNNKSTCDMSKWFHQGDEAIHVVSKQTTEANKWHADISAFSRRIQAMKGTQTM